MTLEHIIKRNSSCIISIIKRFKELFRSTINFNIIWNTLYNSIRLTSKRFKIFPKEYSIFSIKLSYFLNCIKKLSIFCVIHCYIKLNKDSTTKINVYFNSTVLIRIVYLFSSPRICRINRNILRCCTTGFKYK